MRCKFYTVIIYLPLVSAIAFSSCRSTIDRKSVVDRHKVTIREIDSLSSLTLGNGQFAMTMDITGLQTFPFAYQKGVPLGTLSEWGWHSFPPDTIYNIDQTLRYVESHGRQIPYAVQWPSNTAQGRAANYIRQNPHRIHLATIGWNMLKPNGDPVAISDIRNMEQTLDLWNSELMSKFEVEGEAVTVLTFIHQQEDILGVKMESNLVREGRIGLNLHFPYPTDAFLDEALQFDENEPDRLALERTDGRHFTIVRQLDSTRYYAHLQSSLELKSVSPTEKGFEIIPEPDNSTWELVCLFKQNKNPVPRHNFEELHKQTNADFQKFWNEGGMIDFSETEDPRAFELERRMILSLYQTRVNCRGYAPPQETGLIYNSWYGKPHLEMAWWHGVHFALWNRPQVLEKHMEWYLKNYNVAREIAQRQGFKGIRWQKMTDHRGGETASSVGSYLVWQQPHLIYFAELIYRIYKNPGVLEKYKDLVDQTATFMADFTWYEAEQERYILGPGVIPAQERFDPVTTFNPTFELAYWRWGLETAQTWRERLGLERNEEWDRVLAGMSTLPQQDSLYLAAESAPDSYTNARYMTDHPSVLAAYGVLPVTKGLSESVMLKTFDHIWNNWSWEDTWGWDFPMTAMTATRLSLPKKAIDALLMHVRTNTYLKNGHNYQDERLRIYLPGNGGLLTALALMAAGTDENPKAMNGFPSDWKIRFENLHRMP